MRPWDKSRRGCHRRNNIRAGGRWLPAPPERKRSQTKVTRRNVTNGVRVKRGGSLSGFIVPLESRRTEPWEPGSREGNRLVKAAAGQRGQDTEPGPLVYGTDADGHGRQTFTGRTVCLNWARTGLWGLRVSNHPILPGDTYIKSSIRAPTLKAGFYTVGNDIFFVKGVSGVRAIRCS